MKKIISATLLSLSLLLPTQPSLAKINQTLLARTDVQNFIQQMVEKHDFDRIELERWIGQAQEQSDIIAKISKPAEAMPWYKYHDFFLKSDRIQEGVTFWKAHQKALAKAEREYGVPAEIIVAILGVETFYGKKTGTFNVLDALVTLGFDYPPRSKFFLSELEQFLLLTREENWDPTTIKGSYAGAMGNPQFIASSYRKFAVDFNGNGNRDLLTNFDDAIGSVANYCKVNGWQQGQIVVLPAKVKGEKFQPLIASKANPKPNYSLDKLSSLGVNINKYGKPSTQITKQPYALVALEGKEGPEYWLGANNFYVITRYNHSDHYAMAVYTLSEKVKAAYHNANLPT